MAKSNNVAVFIDAENITSKTASKLMEEASNYGDVIIKRVFADWSKPNVSGWKEEISKYSIETHQQFTFVSNKDTSDIALIINAMVVLFERDVDVFCLASSDSDFTSLVQHLRGRGKTVVGFGMKQTAKSFVNAFSEFIYLDGKVEQSKQENEKNGKKHKNNLLEFEKKTNDWLGGENEKVLVEILDRLMENVGKAYYAQVGTEMKNKSSDFIPKNFGCKTMKGFLDKFLQGNDKYEIKTENDGTTMYIVHKK